MDDFITVAQVHDIPPGTGRTVEAKGIWIAVFNVAGTFYAIDNTCPHAGGPLGEGKLCGTAVECPWHGWKFSILTGQREDNPNFEVACCPVRVVGDQIQIALPPGLLNPL
jgi:nitrite reductase/ring-hydroxylating ferredoxin subunit